jgi:hypothetical protein
VNTYIQIHFENKKYTKYEYNKYYSTFKEPHIHTPNHSHILFIKIYLILNPVNKNLVELSFFFNIFIYFKEVEIEMK